MVEREGKNTPEERRTAVASGKGRPFKLNKTAKRSSRGKSRSGKKEKDSDILKKKYGTAAPARKVIVTKKKKKGRNASRGKIFLDLKGGKTIAAAIPLEKGEGIGEEKNSFGRKWVYKLSSEKKSNSRQFSEGGGPGKEKEREIVSSM